MSFPDDKELEAVAESIARFQTRLAELSDQQGRQRCREAANELMSLLQEFVNRLRD